MAGQLALPLYLLQFVAPDLANLAVAMGAPDWADVLLGLGIFAIPTVLLMRRTYMPSTTEPDRRWRRWLWLEERCRCWY